MFEIMTRKAVEQAIGLPACAFTETQLRMGLRNTLEELIKGHLPNQKLRLSRTAVGRRIIQQIGSAAQNVTPCDVVPDSW